MSSRKPTIVNGLEPSFQLSINGRSGRKRSVRSEGELTLLAQSNCQAKRDSSQQAKPAEAGMTIPRDDHMVVDSDSK